MSSERPLKDPLPREIRTSQRQAADPASSIWVEANAGSGKTRVLTDRVLRLMLAEVPPDQILCLTYTKAAAAEMRQRVSDRLAQWALRDEAGLADELADMLDARPDARLMRHARTLFAKALETPGGLKIQTIHAFCESVLHRFPVEAGVPFDFAVLDDFERDAMILEARESVLAGGLDGVGPMAAAVETLFAELSDFGITEAIDTALAENRKLRPVLADRVAAKRRLRRLVRLGPGETRASIEAEITGGYPFGTDAHDAIFALCPPKPGGSRFEDKLAGFELAAIDAGVLFDTYLTKDGEVPRNFPKKDIANGLPALAPQLLAEAERLRELRLRWVRAALVERSEALLDILGAISDRYEAGKRSRSLLDFDDLVARLSLLLRDEGQGPWVRYKLDGGITHILVDESQDTNAEQWDVVKALAAEFFAGDGAVERPRTLFAVGDGKQSIYSFQGADPGLFGQSGDSFGAAAADANKPFGWIELDTSFRTLLGVLEAVDHVFRPEPLRAAVLARREIRHRAARRDVGGTVTLWAPIQQAAEDGDPTQWPLDIPADTRSAPRQVAERIASEIAGWVRSFRPLGMRGRAVRADDVLILVQSRSALFHELIRALHRAGLPTPGADRLNVTSHIAVLDLLALGDVLLNPADDLQLAALLRSPLFDLSEDDLAAVAIGRGRTSLWDALADATGPAATEAAERLKGWRSRLDFERPYDFFARVLHAEGGLRRFHRRMGREVDDVMAEFLELALAHEQTPLPSLQGFLAAMRSREVTIRRELNERGGGVRVMTVHGAKGLEAPIVILADAATRPDGKQTSKPVYLELGAPGPLLVQASSKADHAPETLAFREAEAKRQEDEYWRKLYVAMTRAEDELYVTGVLTKTGKEDGTWYEAIRTALAPLSEIVDDGAEIRFPRERPAAAAATSAPGAGAAAPSPLELAALPAPRLVPILRPSDVGHAADPDRALETNAEAVRDAEAARREGVALHALLQHLPRVPTERWEEIAPRALATLLPEATGRHAALAGKAMSILRRPEFAALFGTDSRAEVPFLAKAARDGRDVVLAGRIDRIVVTADKVLVVDFKSDADPALDAATVKPAYLTQLGLYALVAGQLFPNRQVEAAILWTSLESLLELPRATLAEAARGFTIR